MVAGTVYQLGELRGDTQLYDLEAELRFHATTLRRSDATRILPETQRKEGNEIVRLRKQLEYTGRAGRSNAFNRIQIMKH